MYRYSRKQFLFFLILFAVACHASQSQPVRWQFAAQSNEGQEVLLSFTADLLPGWHVYSQHLQDGGPTPTHIEYNKNEFYSLLGQPQERGQDTQYYDSLYDMEIRWYTGKVLFMQQIILHKPIRFIEGKITYMVCNKELCIPMEEQFKIDIIRKDGP